MKATNNQLLLAGALCLQAITVLPCQGASTRPLRDNDGDNAAPHDTITHNPMTETSVKLGEVVVTGITGSDKIKNTPSPVSVVTPRQLEARASSNIIDAIAHEPGVSQITTGSGISKPVIRGLGYNRVVVVNDGIRQEGQQWGDEHGIEIDGASVHSAEILKGAASLKYGSDAMAGVIVFNPAPAPMEGEMHASAMAGFQSNNALADYSVNFSGHKRHFVWDTRYSGKAAHCYRNSRDGYVPGSAYREQAFAQKLGIDFGNVRSRLTLGYYHSTPGIVEGERDELTGMLMRPKGCSPESYSIAVPYQQIHHYRAVWDNTLAIGNGNLKATVAYQHNRRQEFEEEDAPNECQLDFMLHTVNYDAHYDADIAGNWKVSAGVNGMYQRSLNKGSEFLVPAYHLFDCGIFATAAKRLGKANLTGGVRADRRAMSGDALSCDGTERFAAFKRTFSGVSASIGVAADVLPDVNVKLNLSRGFRAPNISELASNGVHEGTQRYELGNTALRPEGSWQADLGASYSSGIVSAELALFANRIDNYIFSERQVADDGTPATIDGVAAYRFASGKARQLGVEARLDVHPLPRLHIGSSFSYVSSVQMGQPRATRYFPFTPAPRLLADVRYEIACGQRYIDNCYVKLEADCNLRQNHFYAANGTETATPSYTLLNLYAGTDVKRHGRRLFSIYLSCENLADRAYQNHLSRLKYLDRNNATGRMGVCNMGRNFTAKIVVPVDF